MSTQRTSVAPPHAVYWGLIYWDEDFNSFYWAKGSHERIDLVNLKLAMHDWGFRFAGMFIQRFDHELTPVERMNVLDQVNRLDCVLKRYVA